jgi:hypothetical protein
VPEATFGLPMARRPEVRQLLRNIASFRAVLRELRQSEEIDESLGLLADALECFGWIGGYRATPYARLLLDAFHKIDVRIVALSATDPEKLFPERLALWRIADRAGLLRRHVLGSAPDPLSDLLYETGSSTVHRYLRLAVAWLLYGRRSSERELSLLFAAFRDLRLYHLENHYRRKHNLPRAHGGVVLPETERHDHVQKSLEYCTAEKLRCPGMARELRSLHALLERGVPIFAADASPPPPKKLDLRALLRSPARRA